MSARKTILEAQGTWAATHNYEVDPRGYAPAVRDNLRSPLSPAAERAFNEGSGGELKDTPVRPAKMRALHSSAALAVNVFDFWSQRRDRVPLAKALRLQGKISEIGFEGKFPTGLRGTPPNLDVVLKMDTDDTIAIESKFVEWLTPRSRGRAPFKEKYFHKNAELWTNLSFPTCQQEAVRLHQGTATYRYLDAPQLLKHVLGLANQRGDRWKLIYLYFDSQEEEGDQHRAEVRAFSQALGVSAHFVSLSYQELFRRRSELRAEGTSEYLHWLSERYFNPPLAAGGDRLTHE